MLQRDQFSGKQLNISDKVIISQNKDRRLKSHKPPKKTKKKDPVKAMVKPGDLVFLEGDGDKHTSREMYIVTNMVKGTNNVEVKKVLNFFTGKRPTLRLRNYVVSRFEIFKVPGQGKSNTTSTDKVSSKSKPPEIEKNSELRPPKIKENQETSIRKRYGYSVPPSLILKKKQRVLIWDSDSSMDYLPKNRGNRVREVDQRADSPNNSDSSADSDDPGPPDNDQPEGPRTPPRPPPLPPEQPQAPGDPYQHLRAWERQVRDHNMQGVRLSTEPEPHRAPSHHRPPEDLPDSLAQDHLPQEVSSSISETSLPVQAVLPASNQVRQNLENIQEEPLPGPSGTRRKASLQAENKIFKQTLYESTKNLAKARKILEESDIDVEAQPAERTLSWDWNNQCTDLIDNVCSTPNPELGNLSLLSAQAVSPILNPWSGPSLQQDILTTETENSSAVLDELSTVVDEVLDNVFDDAFTDTAYVSPADALEQPVGNIFLISPNISPDQSELAGPSQSSGPCHPPPIHHPLEPGRVYDLANSIPVQSADTTLSNEAPASSNPTSRDTSTISRGEKKKKKKKKGKTWRLLANKFRSKENHSDDEDHPALQLNKF